MFAGERLFSELNFGIPGLKNFKARNTQKSGILSLRGCIAICPRFDKQPSTFQMMMHSMSFVNTQSMVQILSTILLMLQECSIHTEITELSIQVMIFILRNNSRKIQKLYLVLYFYSTVYFCSNIAIYNGIHPKRKKQFNHYH